MSSIAWLSHTLDDGRIACDACHQECKLSEGEYGICGVRKVENAQMHLLTYGHAATVNVGSIEKKPLFHFLPDSDVFSFGTVGCNLSCKFCQNPDISQYPKEHLNTILGRKLSPQHALNLAIENGCQSIAYRYNEPVVFFEYTYDTAKLAYEAGLNNIYVSSGYETRKAIDTILPFLDGMNIDIKGYNESFYKEICGSSLKPVLETLDYAYQKGIWIETSTLLIPGCNDSDQEIRNIAKFQASLDPNIPWHISTYNNPRYKMQNTLKTPQETLARAYDIAKEVGLNYVYTDTMNDMLKESTYCPHCDKSVIDRHSRERNYVTNHLSSKGQCPWCGTDIAGVWF